jgi:hypothetical protein
LPWKTRSGTGLITCFGFVIHHGQWCTLDGMRLLPILCFLLLPIAAAAQQSVPQNPPVPAGEDYSGMYSFLKDGEFLQVTIENDGTVSGFISRFGDSANDKGSFIDQFFKSGKAQGKTLSFTTESVHGVWFTFEGTFDRGAGKKPDDEAYYILRGTLTRLTSDAENKTVSQARQVEFRSFPRDAVPAPR